MVKGIILEGIAGAGKSTLLSRLRVHPFLSKKNLIFYEEAETLGELVAELAMKDLSDIDRCKRIYNLIPMINQNINDGHFVILERFHHSYFALMPKWNLVANVDNVLNEMGFKAVFLDYPLSEAKNRFINRPELADTSWVEDTIKWYGSEENAIAKFAASKKNRKLAFNKSAIGSLWIDTSTKNWDDYVESIIKFITA